MTATAHFKGGPHDGRTLEVERIVRVLRFPPSDSKDNGEYVCVQRDPDDLATSGTYEWRIRDA